MATVVTATGDNVAAGRMKGSTPTQAEPVFFNWDLNPATLTAAKTDVALFKEGTETRVTGTTSLITGTYVGDTWQNVATQTAGGTVAAGGFALFDSATKPFSTTVSSGAIIGSNSATTVTLGATYTPANGTYIQIRTEVMLVTAGTGTASITVTRAQNGSAAISTIAASDAVTAGNIPGSTTITGGTIFVKGDMPVLNLVLNDQATITTKVTFS
jgi:hypothetical protein